MIEIRKLEQGYTQRGLVEELNIPQSIPQSTSTRRIKCGTTPESLGRFSTEFTLEKEKDH